MILEARAEKLWQKHYQLVILLPWQISALVAQVDRATVS